MKGIQTLAKSSDFTLGVTQNGWKFLNREVTSSDDT